MHQTYMFYLCETILWKFAAHGSKLELKGEKNGLRKMSVFYFHMTVCPRNMHHYTQFGYKRLSSSEDIFWTKPDASNIYICSIYVRLYCGSLLLMEANWNLKWKNGLRKMSVFYFHMTVCPRNMHHYTQFGYKRLSSSEDIFWTKPDRQTEKHDDSSTPPNFAKRDIINGL